MLAYININTNSDPKILGWVFVSNLTNMLQFLQIVHVDDTAIQQRLFGEFFLIRPVIHNLTWLIPYRTCYGIFHVTHHLGISAKAFYQLANSRCIVCFVAVCQLIIRVILVKASHKLLIVPLHGKDRWECQTPFLMILILLLYTFLYLLKNSVAISDIHIQSK